MKSCCYEILILTNDAGGLYNFRKELIISLLERGAVVVSAPANEYLSLFQSMGCKCVSTAISRRKKNPLVDLKLYLFSRNLIKREKPLTVLTYTIKPNIFGGARLQIKES